MTGKIITRFLLGLSLLFGGQVANAAEVEVRFEGILNLRIDVPLHRAFFYGDPFSAVVRYDDQTPDTSVFCFAGENCGRYDLISWEVNLAGFQWMGPWASNQRIAIVDLFNPQATGRTTPADSYAVAGQGRSGPPFVPSSDLDPAILYELSGAIMLSRYHATVIDNALLLKEHFLSITPGRLELFFNPLGGGGIAILGGSVSRVTVCTFPGGVEVCTESVSIPDADGDGEQDNTDRCPNTPTMALIDDSGCSQEQYCSAIVLESPALKGQCSRADWLNDEPVAQPRDCKVTGTVSGGLTCTDSP